MIKEINKGQAEELLKFIKNKWNDFIFEDKNAPKDSDNPEDILYLPEKYIAPNKEKFKAMFYWDSYFIMQGLRMEKNRQSLISGIVDNCLYEVEIYGKVLNANKKKWSTRSQLPYLVLLIKNVYEIKKDKKWLEKAFGLAKKEYNKYWLDKCHLTETGLSRYYDESGGTAIGDYKKSHTYKSRAEASWDMSPRFNESDIGSLAPIDLNCNLYQYEKCFSEFAEFLGDKEEAAIWKQKAEKRKGIVNNLMWDEKGGLFYDYNFKTGKKKKVKSLAGYQAMFVGLASKKQAEALKDNIKTFETNGGLAACAEGIESPDNQWDWPTIWAPLQFVCYRGLQKYGYKKEADKIAENFIWLVFKNWKETGEIWEKYNGKTADLSGISERYPSQSGFGWTNAVAEVFIKEQYNL